MKLRVVPEETIGAYTYWYPACVELCPRSVLHSFSCAGHRRPKTLMSPWRLGWPPWTRSWWPGSSSRAWGPLDILELTWRPKPPPNAWSSCSRSWPRAALRRESFASNWCRRLGVALQGFVERPRMWREDYWAPRWRPVPFEPSPEESRPIAWDFF